MWRSYYNQILPSYCSFLSDSHSVLVSLTWKDFAGAKIELLAKLMLMILDV